MKPKILAGLSLMIALCLPAMAANPVTFFSDLGPQGNVYNCCSGWIVSGNGYVGTSYTQASLFTSAATGSVTQIDLGVTYVDGQNSFYAALFTNDNGRPGSQLARWDNLSSSQNIGGCCALVTITGITGVSLTAGQKYFLVLGPMSVDDSSFLTWALNTINYSGVELISTDGGTTWNTTANVVLSGAFDVVGN